MYIYIIYICIYIVIIQINWTNEKLLRFHFGLCYTESNARRDNAKISDDQSNTNLICISAEIRLPFARWGAGRRTAMLPVWTCCTCLDRTTHIGIQALHVQLIWQIAIKPGETNKITLCGCHTIVYIYIYNIYIYIIYIYIYISSIECWSDTTEWRGTIGDDVDVKPNERRTNMLCLYITWR